MSHLTMRKAAIFAAIFFAANLAFDAYRRGGLTLPVVGTALLTTAVATLLYVGFLYLLGRRRDGRK